MPHSPDAARLLVVEDERHLATGLKLNFEFEGYEVVLAGTIREARARLTDSGPFDALVLDVSLPDGDGFHLCRRLRDAGDYTPVIMLTARSLAADRVTGLEAGADDYLTKPFELDELLARVRSMLRRRRWEASLPETTTTQTVLEFGRARVDFESHEVTVDGKPIRMTSLELKLLQYLHTHSGRVISREELLKQVWQLRNYPNTRTVDNFVLRLRKHFEISPARPQYFVSIRGAGYRFLPHGDE